MHRKILEPISPYDSPRAGTRLSIPGHIAEPREYAGGEPVRGGGVGLARYPGSSGWPATATIGGLPAGRRGYNIVREDAAAGTAARNLSTDNAAGGNKLGLAWKMNGDILDLGPREVLLPKVKPRREALTSHRGVSMRCKPPPEESKTYCTTLPLATRWSHAWPISWHTFGRDSPIATLDRLRRKTGILIRRY